MSEAMATRWCARLALVLGAGVWAGPSQAGPHDGLPQRNLLVEWRVSGQGRSEQRQGGVEMGRIVIDSRMGVIGRAGVSAGTLRTETDGNTVQQVMVLKRQNTGRPSLTQHDRRVLVVLASMLLLTALAVIFQRQLIAFARRRRHLGRTARGRT